MSEVKNVVTPERNVEYKGKGEVEFILTEKEKEFITEQLHYETYRNPKIKATYMYVRSEDRFYGEVKKYNILGAVETVFFTKEQITDNRFHEFLAEKLACFKKCLF